MDHSFKLHIEFIEKQLHLLNRKVMEEDGLTAEERNRIESEIRAAKLALEHYQKAFVLEDSLHR